MKHITLYKSDFHPQPDSEGMHYFHYLLSQLGIPERKWDMIEMIEFYADESTIETDMEESTSVKIIKGFNDGI